MEDQLGTPRRSNWTRWMDPRGKSVGSIGFLMNRVAGLGLTLYLFMHLIVLGTLSKGESAFDGFIKLAHNPIFVAGEFVVILAVVLHGFNGLRIALTGFGNKAGSQKLLLLIAITIALAASIYFGFRMFGGE